MTKNHRRIACQTREYLTEFFQSAAIMLLLWLLASLLLAGFLTPILYEMGKNLAQSAKSADYPFFIELLAHSADRAKPERYFNRALLLSAIALLPLLIYRINKLPFDPKAYAFRLRKSSAKQGIASCFLGLSLGASSVGLLLLFLELSDACLTKNPTISLGNFFTKAVMPALGAGVIEELVFRGLLLGLLLKACSPRKAWITCALVFAFVHFLNPSPHISIPDPKVWYAGLQVSVSIFENLAHLPVFLTHFTTLTLLGLLLGFCRLITKSLWLPIGLHVGFVISIKSFSIWREIDLKSPLYPWFIGNDLKSGILPALLLALCFLAVKPLIKHLPFSPKLSPEKF